MSSRQAAALLVAMALVLLPACGRQAERPTSVSPPTPATSAPTVPSGAQEARVVRVVDGDTVRLVGRGPGPLPAGVEDNVRLLEVDAPEVTGGVECYGREAGAELARLAPRGSSVRVVADRDLRDRYGRALLYLWNERGVLINDALVARGFARAVLYGRNDRYIAVLRASEVRARAAKRGQWGACPRSGAQPTQPP